MTRKITLKELRRHNNGNIRKCKANELYYLLRLETPDYYYYNKYGWQFDVYCVNGMVLLRGYDSIKQATDLREKKEYEEKAEAVWFDRTLTNEEREEKINRLLLEFCNINL